MVELGLATTNNMDVGYNTSIKSGFKNNITFSLNSA